MDGPRLVIGAVWFSLRAESISLFVGNAAGRGMFEYS